jgi:hypothetical protein
VASGYNIGDVHSSVSLLVVPGSIDHVDQKCGDQSASASLLQMNCNFTVFPFVELNP